MNVPAVTLMEMRGNFLHVQQAIIKINAHYRALGNSKMSTCCGVCLIHSLFTLRLGLENKCSDSTTVQGYFLTDQPPVVVGQNSCWITLNCWCVSLCQSLTCGHSCARRASSWSGRVKGCHLMTSPWRTHWSYYRLDIRSPFSQSMLISLLLF